jgi:hypothetical protein
MSNPILKPSILNGNNHILPFGDDSVAKGLLVHLKDAMIASIDAQMDGLCAEITADGGATFSDLERILFGFTQKLGIAGLSAMLSKIPESTPICPDCQKPMKNHGRREKQLVSLFGNMEYKRNYYICECCSTGATPKDDMLGVKGTSFTPEVTNIVGYVAARESFAESFRMIKKLCKLDIPAKDCERIAESLGEEIIENKKNEMKLAENLKTHLKPEEPVQKLYIEYDGTGIPIQKKELQGVKGKQEDGSAKTREVKTGCIFTQTTLDKDGKAVRDPSSTTFFARIGSQDEFGPLLYAEAVKRGIDYAKEVIVLGDGAKWIWGLADQNFHKCVEIVDLFHAKEHVANLVKSIISDPDAVKKKKDELYEILEKGDIPELVKQFNLLGAKDGKQLEGVKRESNYFLANQKRMNYAHFRAKGYFVGSGVIEATCKNVIGKRLKQSGMHWSVAGANKIAALRCKELSAEVENCLAQAA